MAYAVIDKPSDYFNTVLYTGTGSSLANTGVGFQPDWVWIKGRSGATEHVLTDSVRGVTKELSSNDNGAEETVAQGLTAFGSDGFTVGTDGSYNTSSATYVSWNWRAETAFTNDASETGIGSIDSAGSVNTDAGFSIISWTGDGNNGATIAHGLGTTPAIVITKRRDDTGDWLVGGSLINTVRGGANSLLLLNTNAAMDSNSEVYQTFSSTTFQVGVNAYTNTNNATMISYCFKDVQGYSKFGSYAGNGNADGAFVYTGFKPAWVMTKRTDSTGSWHMQDNKRDGFNYNNHRLFADASGTEETTVRMDLLSNGFKYRDGDGNSGTNIYLAFADNPFTTSTGIPATTR